MSGRVQPGGAPYGPPGGRPRRRASVRLLLVLVLVVAPLLELFVLIQVGRLIGAWPTVALLLVSAVLGAWLVRREGRRAWAALSSSLQAGRVPAREVTDAGLVLLGGFLMIAPGFVTDVIGLLLVLPLTRPVARRLVGAAAARRAGGSSYLGTTGFGVPGFGAPGPDTTNGPRPGGRRPAPGEDVVRGEVVDDPPRDD